MLSRFLDLPLLTRVDNHVEWARAAVVANVLAGAAYWMDTNIAVGGVWRSVVAGGRGRRRSDTRGRCAQVWKQRCDPQIQQSLFCDEYKSVLIN